MSERVHRSVMNIKVGMLFYVLSLFLAFFSRKIFLDCLGTEFIGLTGMLMNIMSFLSVAELGIGTSIVYFLYKPLQEDNHEKINEVMSMLAYLYRCIGAIIGAAGIAISLFFPWWFSHLDTRLPLVYFAFYSFLASSVAGYLFNYKQLLVGANQKQYLVNAYFQTIGIVQSIVQILLAYYYRNLWLWVVVGLIFTFIGIIVFNIRIRQLYPWLHVSLTEGRRNLKKYPEVLKKTRQIFIQKIKNFILYKSDEILVGAFVSVVHVAFYGNYTIITSKLNFLVNILSDGMNAGVGNLVAEGNDQNTMKVFWELTAVRFLIAGIIIFGLLLFLQPFVVCWFGAQYRLSDLIVYLLIFNIFIFLTRGVVEMYISAHGLFSDVWTAWTELILNIGITLALAPFYGIVGILLGKIVSVFFIAMFWKPYFLFSKGLNKSVSVYWRGMAAYYLLFALFATASVWLSHNYISSHSSSMIEMISFGSLTYVPLLTTYFLMLFVSTKGMKYFVARKPKLYRALQQCLQPNRFVSPFWSAALLSVLNLVFMHYYILNTASMDDEANFTRFADNILAIATDWVLIVLIAYVVTGRRLKATSITTFFVTLLWSFSNVLYSRFFHHYISLSAIAQGGSLFDSFMLDCLRSGLRWTDCYYLVVTFIFLWLFAKYQFYTKQLTIKLLSVLFFCLTTNIMSYIVYCSLSPERRYLSFLTERMEARHFSTSLQLCNPNVAAFRRGSVRTLTSEMLMNLQGPIKLSEAQAAAVSDFIDRQNAIHYRLDKQSVPQNVIFIIVESYMSFVADMKVDGREVTPFLNSLRRDSCTYYNGNLHKNVTIGESSDGQFIYMTGLLPLRSIVTISEARKNVLPPSLPQQLGYPSRMIIPTVETMWRQDEMCRQYGFDKLYTSKDYAHGYHSILTDEQIFQLAEQLDKTSSQPFFSVVLTMSMHQPYDEQPDQTFPIRNKSMRKDLASYLNKCHYTDRQLKRYFEHLKRTGLAGKSLVVLASDHPVLSTDFGGVNDHVPLYLIHSQGWPADIWKGECNQLDVYSTLIDLLCRDSQWYGLGRSLLLHDYKSTVTNDMWDLSEQLIMGDYFQTSKRQQKR